MVHADTDDHGDEYQAECGDDDGWCGGESFAGDRGEDGDDKYKGEEGEYAEKYFGSRSNGTSSYLTNVEYFGDVRGEIDIYAFVDDTLYIVEYKKRNTDRSFSKAINQLRRAEEWAVPTGIDYELIFMWGRGQYKNIHKKSSPARNAKNC